MTISRQPPTLLFELGSAVASPAVCAQLAQPLRRLLAEVARRDGVTIPDSVAAFAEALETGARLYRKRAARAAAEVSAEVSTETPSRFPSVTVDLVTYSAPEFAKLMHCTPQAVAKRCRSGSLQATKDAQGKWRIYADQENA